MTKPAATRLRVHQKPPQLRNLFRHPVDHDRADDLPIDFRDRKIVLTRVVGPGKLTHPDLHVPFKRPIKLILTRVKHAVQVDDVTDVARLEAGPDPHRHFSRRYWLKLSA